MQGQLTTHAKNGDEGNFFEASALGTRWGLTKRARITRCSVESCDTYAKSGGKCCKHGGGTRCSVEGCDKHAQSGGKEKNEALNMDMNRSE